MKLIATFTVLSLVILSACNKEPVTTSTINSKPKADGSGKGGGNTTTGLIQSVLSGNAARLIAGTTDSIWVSFTQPAPPGGWVLNLTSSNPGAAQVASTHVVPAGQRSAQPHVTGGQITNATTATITVRLNTETKSTTIKVFPLTATFPAPPLQSPGNNKTFKPREIVDFTWAGNNNAYYYQLQIANNSSFTNPETDLLLNDPFWRQSAFSGLTLYWRVRYVAAGGGSGPWSEVRTFSIKQ